MTLNEFLNNLDEKMMELPKETIWYQDKNALSVFYAKKNNEYFVYDAAFKIGPRKISKNLYDEIHKKLWKYEDPTKLSTEKINGMSN